MRKPSIAFPYNHYQLEDAKDAAGNEAFLHAGTTLSAWGILIGDERGLFSMENSERALVEFTKLMGTERFKLTIRDAMPVWNITWEEFNDPKAVFVHYHEPDNEADEVPAALKDNVMELLRRVNIVRNHWGKETTMSCSYRSKAWDLTEDHGHKKRSGESAHCYGMAIDFNDIGHALYDWLFDNQWILEEADLYMENKKDTPSWCHLQSRPTKSRVFNAY